MKRLIAIMLLTGALFSFGCAGKHPSDVLAPVITKSSQIYHFANQTMTALYDVCKMQGDRCPAALQPIVTHWNQIDDKCDLIDEQFTKVEDLWLDVSRLKSPESIQEFNKQWSVLSRLIDELVAMVPALKTVQIIPSTPFGGAMIDDLPMPQNPYGGNQ